MELRRQGYKTKKIPLNLNSGDKLKLPKVYLTKAISKKLNQKHLLNVIVNQVPSEIFIQSTNKSANQYFQMTNKRKTIRLPSGQYVVKISYKGQNKQRIINFTPESNTSNLTYQVNFKPADMVNGR